LHWLGTVSYSLLAITSDIGIGLTSERHRAVANSPDKPEIDFASSRFLHIDSKKLYIIESETKPEIHLSVLDDCGAPSNNKVKKLYYSRGLEYNDSNWSVNQPMFLEFGQIFLSEEFLLVYWAVV
jgi:hypothetical protein